MQGNARSHAIAEDVGIFDIEVLQECGDVVCHLLERHRPLTQCGAPVPFQLDGDHLIRFRQRRHKLGVHTDPAEAAVQQHHRFAAAVQLIV